MANRVAQIAAALVVLAASAGDLPASAPDLRPELEPTGRIDDLAISPSGRLWFGTAVGHAYASDDRARSWQEVAVTARRDDPRAAVPVRYRPARPVRDPGAAGADRRVRSRRPLREGPVARRARMAWKGAGESVERAQLPAEQPA